MLSVLSLSGRKSHCYSIDTRFRIGAPCTFCDHLGFENLKPLEFIVIENGKITGNSLMKQVQIFFQSIWGKSKRKFQISK